jgi:hypothetical protein
MSVAAIGPSRTSDDLSCVKTSLGTIQVEWGVNRWVLVSPRRADVQRQVTTRAQLTDLLEEVGLPSAEGADVAAAAELAPTGLRLQRLRGSAN